MFRRHHRFFASLQVCRDVVLVAASFALAYVGRFSAPAAWPYGAVASMHETLAVGLMLVVIWTLTAWAGGLYASQRARSAVTEIFEVCRTTAVALVLLAALTYFAREVRYSRAVLALWAALCVLLLGAARLLVKAVLGQLRARGHNLRHLLVVGAGELASRVIANVERQAGLGLRVVGSVALDGQPYLTGATLGGRPVLGCVGQLGALLRQQPVDQVVVALRIEELGALGAVMDVLSRETVDVRLVPDLAQYVTLCGSVEEFGGMPIINLQATPLLGWNKVLKRAFDLGAAALGLLAVAPVLALLAAAVRLSGPGPILFRQERVGLDGRPFAMLKFRTMQGDAEAGGARMAVAGDPRCTRLGALLRRCSLDELPQLVNVLRGEMSLVGPRPERPCFIETFTQEVPRYALRHKIKAGMTGWAQVNGLRGNTSIARRIELDLYYIENWSLLLDLKILLRTVLGGFLSPHAY